MNWWRRWRADRHRIARANAIAYAYVYAGSDAAEWVRDHFETEDGAAHE